MERMNEYRTLSPNASGFHETLEAEVAGALVFTRHEYVIRPKVTYAFTDRWKGIVGADLFRGNRRDNTTAYAEFRWSF
ncbi:MAG: hypothetical protein ACRENG_23975 [bacterium]